MGLLKADSLSKYIPAKIKLKEIVNLEQTELMISFWSTLIMSSICCIKTIGLYISLCIRSNRLYEMLIFNIITMLLITYVIFNFRICLLLGDFFVFSVL